MNKRFALAWLVVFIAWFIGSFVTHGILLHEDYMAAQTLFRPESEAQKLFPLMILAHVIMSGAFVWIFQRGIEVKPWMGQGIRYGIAVWLLASLPIYFIYYVVQPMPLGTVVKQVIFEAILLVILGLIVAFMYRRTSAT
jgi:hypothetical protein